MNGRYHLSPATLDDLFMGAVNPIQWYVDEGLITRRAHLSYPYAILNYTDKCVYDRHWDLVTRKCRGLIYQLGDKRILARPFEKFFNLGEPDAPEVSINTPGDAYDKLDGSLGILYRVGQEDVRGVSGQIAWGDSYAVATRGSFDSQQARWATNHWRQYYNDFTPLEGYTYLFEIIYPDNRIVLDYGDTEGLFLLDVLDNALGMSIRDVEWPGPRVDTLAEDITLEDALKIEDRENKEGLVWVEYGTGTRVKLKQQDYVEKHKIVFGLNARAVWEVLSPNTAYTDEAWANFVSWLPEEFHEWAEDCARQLWIDYRHHRDWAYDLYNSIIEELGSENYTRKEFAQTARRVAAERNMGDYFLMTFLILDGDGEKLNQWCWRRVYPSADWRPEKNFSIGLPSREDSE